MDPHIKAAAFQVFHPVFAAAALEVFPYLDDGTGFSERAATKNKLRAGYKCRKNLEKRAFLQKGLRQGSGVTWKPPQ